MYNINGVGIDNPTFGWYYRQGSSTLSDIMRQTLALRVPGRDGVLTLPATVAAPVIMIKVNTPRANLESLYALFMKPNGKLANTDAPGREVGFEYLAASTQSYGRKDAFVDVSFALRLNGVYWRDVATTDSPAVATALTLATQPLSVFAGLSAPIADAILKVKGAVTGLRIEDGNGSWFTLSGALSTAETIFFHTATGEAFIGALDVTDRIDYGGSQGGFLITPSFTTDPSIRAGALTIITATRTSATVQVTGRGAYIA